MNVVSILTRMTEIFLSALFKPASLDMLTSTRVAIFSHITMSGLIALFSRYGDVEIA